MNSFAELEKWYEVDFPVKRILTTAQRSMYDAKAHVVMEYLMFDFKYVPRENNTHVYLFKNETDAAKFDKITDSVGKDK